MCCWGYEDVYLEDPPPPKEKPKDENTYIMMSSEMPKPAEQPVEAPQPAYIPAEPMYYAPAPGHGMYYQAAVPAPKAEEPKSEPAPSPFGDPNTEFYCRELDGSWSLRTCTDIVKNCQPGFWQTNAKSGWPVYYRQA